MIIDDLKFFLLLEENLLDREARVVERALCPPGGAGGLLEGWLIWL